jgi:hypothetical protein
MASYINKSFTLLIFLLAIEYYSFSQQSDDYFDSLKKYSYYISGFVMKPNRVSIVTGTGFFIRNREVLFLVTAKHVLSGCNDSLLKDKDSPDTMIIWLKNDNMVSFKFIPINVSVIKDTSSCLPFFKSPDIIVLQVSDTNLIKNAHSVEKYIYPPFMKTNGIQIFGFPFTENMKLGSYRYTPSSNLSMPTNNNEIITNTNYIKNGEVDEVDSINRLCIKPTI